MEIADIGLSVCSITPSDQAGSIDNILSRLEAIEQAIRELQSQNIGANQLSDLSPNTGWLYNVTYMGQPGWTQTQAGTLIPPTGVSLSSLGLLMSDGTPWSFISTDSDGNTTFGIGADGSALGASFPYAIIDGANTPMSRGITIVTNTSSSDAADAVFEVTESGIYIASASGKFTASVGVGDVTNFIAKTTVSDDPTGLCASADGRWCMNKGFEMYITEALVDFPDGGDINISSATGTSIHKLAIGDTVGMNTHASTGSDPAHTASLSKDWRFSIVKVSA